MNVITAAQKTKAQPPPSLAAKARSAALWNTGFNLFRDLLQFCVMLVMVRILSPSAYGQFTLVTSVIGLISVFSFNNFLAYTLQVKTEEELHYQEQFTAGGVFQLGAFVLANIVALILPSFPAYAPVAPLVHLMSLGFLLDWPCQFRCRMLERQFDWKRLRLLHASGLIVSSVVALIMAAFGAGVFALLVPGMLVTLPFIFDLLVRERWRPTWSWSWTAYKPAWQFGVTRLGSGLISNGRQIAESALLAAMIGFDGVGVFNRAVGLAQMLCYKVASQLMSAIYPVLTRVSDNGGQATRVGDLVFRIVSWSVVPIATIFSACSEPIVLGVYGAKWSAIVPLLPWAMVWGAVSAMVYAGYMLLLARQHPRSCLAADLLVLSGTGLSLYLGLGQGTKGYLVCLVLVQSAVLLLEIVLLRRCSAISLRGLFDAIVPPATAVGVSSLATLLAVAAVKPQWTLSLTDAAICATTILVMYVGLLRIAFPRQLADIIRYFPRHHQIERMLFLGAGALSR